MNRPAVFFPCFINRLDSPIPTIHRRIAENSSNLQFETISNDWSYSNNDFTKIYRVPGFLSYYSGIPIYVLAYLQYHDIVHTGPRDRDRLAILSKLRGSKLIHTLHATPTNDTVLRRERKLTKQADAVTAVSEYVKKWARETISPDKQITVISNGVDLSYFSPSDSHTHNYCLYVANLVDRKNPLFICELAKKIPDIDFKIIGRGPYQRQVTEESNNQNNLFYTPRVSRKNLAEEFSKASITLCPFQREGFGMVVIESMSSGTPVIGLNDGNLPNLITNNINGYLCDSLDESAWASYIKTALDGELSPRKSVEKFGWNKVACRYSKFYHNVLEENT